jgi:putative ABC transport system permease protein
MIDGILDALENIVLNPLRSFLTMLGVIIGVFSVVTLVSIGEGAKRYVNDQFAALGSNVIVVTPGGTRTSGGPPLITDAQHKLTLEDARSLRRCASVTHVAPIVLGTASLKVGGKLRDRSTVIGTSAEFQIARSMFVQHGHFLPEGDAAGGRNVCVIGQTVLKDLYPDGRLPLGEWMRINQTPYRIIGVMEHSSFGMGFDINDLVFVPVNAAMQLFDTDEMFEVVLKCASAERVKSAIDEVTGLMKRRHDNTHDFTVHDQGQIMEAMGNVLNILTFALGGIAAISLLVGGIGIMNIMLVSVGEKTREIGVRKAVGATRGDILWQFLVESTTISVAGGAIGAAFGTLLALGLHWAFPKFPVEIKMWTIIVALTFAIGVGVFFGVYPARKAARLDPIEALRYE